MRKTFVAAAVATIFSAGAFLASGANAMTLTAPAGMRLATEGVNVAEPIRHRCYRSRSGRLVCHAHRRVVAVAPGYGYGYGYGYPAYGYGYGYPSIGIGIGYGGWWGGGYGWGGHSVVRSRTIVHRHHHHRGHRR